MVEDASAAFSGDKVNQRRGKKYGFVTGKTLKSTGTDQTYQRFNKWGGGHEEKVIG